MLVGELRRIADEESIGDDVDSLLAAADRLQALYYGDLPARVAPHEPDTREPENEANASEPREPTESANARARQFVADVGRTAHWLLNDRGYTNALAASDLANLARTMNRALVTPWSADDLKTILGDAGK
jgi:hypothetical protein